MLVNVHGCNVLVYIGRSAVVGEGDSIVYSFLVLWIKSLFICGKVHPT
jgi:hypothetical protein